MKAIKQIRLVHRYLSLFFAPLILLFAVSGVTLTLGLDRVDKQKKESPSLVHSTLSRLHKAQRLPSAVAGTKTKTSKILRYFSAAMGVALAISTVLGIAIAFSFSKSLLISAIVFGTGMLTPIIALWLGGGLG